MALERIADPFSDGARSSSSTTSGGLACVAGLGAWVSRETRHERLQSALSEPAVLEHVSIALEFLGPEAREYVLLALPEPEPVHAPWTFTQISRDSEVQP